MALKFTKMINYREQGLYVESRSSIQTYNYSNTHVNISPDFHY